MRCKQTEDRMPVAPRADNRLQRGKGENRTLTWSYLSFKGVRKLDTSIFPQVAVLSLRGGTFPCRHEVAWPL